MKDNPARRKGVQAGDYSLLGGVRSYQREDAMWDPSGYATGCYKKEGGKAGEKKTRGLAENEQRR